MGGNIEKLAVTGKVEAERSQGRCPLFDQIRTIRDFTSYNALQVAEDRMRWHNIIKLKVIDEEGDDS